MAKPAYPRCVGREQMSWIGRYALWSPRNQRSPATDIEHWIELHETELHQLARREGAHDDTVHFLATLVLVGAPELLHEVRQLVATS